jgi:golgi-specific brefeldin A-resistance guanine nucleotide exchange factor 1
LLIAFIAFDNAEDNLALEKAIVCFQRCAYLASSFNMQDVLDNIVISLSKMTGLLRDNGRLPPHPPVILSLSGDSSKKHNSSRKTVDIWTVDFGRSFKSQVAAVIMFNLATEYGNLLQSSWKNVLQVVLLLSPSYFYQLVFF